MKKRLKIFLSAVILAVLIAGIQRPELVMAAEGSVTFGSETYETRKGSSFNVGVYIECDEGLGEFQVELEYDNARLSYIKGANSEKDGILLMKGSRSKKKLRYWLTFRALSGGNTELEIKSASIKGRNSTDSTKVEVTITEPALVKVSGEDIVSPQEAQREPVEVQKPREEQLEAANQEELKEEFAFTDIPLAGKTEIQGGNYYIVDLSQYLPREADWIYRKETIDYNSQTLTCLTDADKRVKFVYLIDRAENMYLYAYGKEKGQLYPCSTVTLNGEKYYCMSPYVVEEWPEGLTLDLIQSESIVYAMDLTGQCDFYKIRNGNKLLIWDEDEGQTALQKQTNKLLIILGIALLVMVLTVIVAVLLNRGRKQKQSAKAEQAFQKAVAAMAANVTEGTSKRLFSTSGNDILVIAVQHVTMKFKIAMSNVSGIKEYIIQLLKKQISYRELLALDDVSFNIYKGEVVGIIGTNGSGKSTLLKIVSGALNPTSGKVLVNRKKIQLLTLGTGFDMELTAKENVYLNGAIIGYTKEFIDEHYEEIVRFAELEDFMEEKVKNFSSGMVSRLGFAIATVGEAAEILILDEVLSVGDEFFRKKSLARVKEMIHCGSTVLLVSHSLETIMENCTKVVWIEKGVLKMVGEPRKVCMAYRKMHEEK